MKNDRCLEIKQFLDTHSYDDVVKGILAHYYEIHDTSKLDTIYLMYMDNDNILSIISEDIVSIIKKNIE